MGAFPVRQYQPGGEFTVVRAMDYLEHHFEAGEDFPWRKLGIHEAQVQMLWKAVRIEVKRPSVASAAAAPPSSPSTPAVENLSDAELERLTAPAPVTPPAAAPAAAPPRPAAPPAPAASAKRR
jgi:hypothetical protein